MKAVEAGFGVAIGVVAALVFIVQRHRDRQDPEVPSPTGVAGQCNKENR